MANTSIRRTNSGNGNRKKWTVSWWEKKNKLGAVQRIFSCDEAGNNNHDDFFQWQTDDKLVIGFYDSGYYLNLTPDRNFRDTNGWYHFVFTWDTAQATASDRAKFYINGVRETVFATETYPSQNQDSFINTTEPIEIGKRSDNDTQYLESTLSHIHFCDGYAYTPSDFGSTDSTTGEWKINTSPSVSYGTNGFFILKDGNSLTDESPNSNNWSSVSGTLTKTEDNPSNVFCTLNGNIPQAGGLNGRDGSASTSLDNGNTTAGEGAAVFSNQLGTIFASSGKYYAECKFGGDQYCSFGVASPNFSDASLGSYPGASITGVNTAGIYGNGGIARVNGSTIFTDSNITTDTICLAMDLDNGALYIRRNDSAWMNSGNPESGATKTGAITLPSDTYTWVVTSHNNSGSGRNYMKVNFGNGYFGTTAVSSAGTNASNNGIFEYNVPAGYTALSTKGLNL